MKAAEQTWKKKKKKKPKKKEEKRGTRIGIVKQSEGGRLDGSSHDMEPAMPRWMEGGEAEDGGAVARRRGSRRRVERAKSVTRCKGERAEGKRAESARQAGDKRDGWNGAKNWAAVALVYTRTADAEADCRSRSRSRPRRKRRMQTADAEARLRHSQRCENAHRRRVSHHHPVDAERGLSFFAVQFRLGGVPSAR